MIGTQFIGVPADKGGAIEYLSFKIAEGLQSKEFNITFFSVNPLINYFGRTKIERFPAKKTNALFFSVFIFWKCLFKKFDAVYVSGCSMIFAGLLISKIKGIPLIYHEFNHNPWIKSSEWLYDVLAVFSIKISDYVIVPAESIKKSILSKTKINKEKFFLISNFIDLNEFPQTIQKKEKKILFAGRLVEHKGINFLIELIESGELDDWKFCFTGSVNKSSEEKKYFDKLNLLAESNKNILFKPNLSRKDLIKEFSSAGIFVLPSSQESFGMVLIEAMACFTPCVAFSVGGTKEIIDSGKNGFLAELKDKKEFELKLKELMNNKEKRIFFGLNARKKVEENFSFETSIKKFESFFNKKVKIK